MTGLTPAEANKRTIYIYIYSMFVNVFFIIMGVVLVGFLVTHR